MAASNGSAQSVYPWGDSEPTDALAVFSADGCFQNDTCLSGPSAVGSKPLGANQLGHRDLAGNVREWVLDAAAPYPTAESKNYTNNQDLLYRLDRGGSFYDFADDLRAATRGEVNFPVSGLYFHGLRCARTPLHAHPSTIDSRRHPPACDAGDGVQLAHRGIRLRERRAVHGADLRQVRGDRGRRPGDGLLRGVRERDAGLRNTVLCARACVPGPFEEQLRAVRNERDSMRLGVLWGGPGVPRRGEERVRTGLRVCPSLWLELLRGRTGV
jgi:hypothetical protein